jgi:hypothetical protein
LLWLVTDADLEYPGRFVARAHTADHQGGTYLPGALVAESLDDLRQQIPKGLTRRDRTSVDPPEVLETWG